MNAKANDNTNLIEVLSKSDTQQRVSEMLDAMGGNKESDRYQNLFHMQKEMPSIANEK
ncbi:MULTISPECIES: hypothetical protein [Cysteiniphilum]|uniref:hypothetical protein n=1 Tax=Cysteiniphilum TaxID=2056696 RepID=UPI001785F50B|nr:MULTISPECIES: hypothetical protein [Cysteiniphilum]